MRRYPQYRTKPIEFVIRLQPAPIQIIPVRLYGSETQIDAYGFVDDGANVSMVDSNITRALGLQGETNKLELQWLNDHHSRLLTEKVTLAVSGVGENAEKFTIKD